MKLSYYVLSGLISMNFCASAFADDNSSSQSSNESQQVASQPLISDGTLIEVDELGLSITPPTGWEVIKNEYNLSFVIQEPKKENEKPNYKDPKFQRHITVAAMHSSSPIDDKRAAELEAELVKKSSDSALISDFTVFDRKFFDYKGKDDGLVLYSTLKINQFDMMQMHVLLSGESKQFLLTYTDLAKRFQADESTLTSVWQTMTTVDVLGFSPIRYMKEIQLSSGIAGGLFVVLATVLYRRRKDRISFERFHSELDSGSFDGDFDSLESDGWSLDAQPVSYAENNL